MGILQIYDTGFGLKLVDPETSETGGSTGAVTLDLTSSRNFDITAAGAITYTFANPPSGRRLTTTFKLVLENGGTGIQTWPASVTWLSGSAPTLKTSGTNILEFTTKNGGTTWLAQDLTPSSDASSITTTQLNGAGFVLDPSKVNEIRFVSKYATATATDPYWEFSTNGGTTWAGINASTIAHSNWGTFSGTELTFNTVKAYLLSNVWYFNLISENRGFGDPNSITSNTTSALYSDGRLTTTGGGSPFTPTASMVYRIRFGGTITILRCSSTTY